MARHDRLHRCSACGRPSAARAEGALICHETLHELRSEHAAQLPVAGPGCQRYLPIRKLLGITRRAWDPAAAPAAGQLARRLIMECPVPQAPERMRLRQLGAAAARTQG